MSEDIILNSSILVIDDSLLILTIIKDMLKDQYDVRLASSVDKAFSMLSEYTPDLILLDLEMPEKNGFEFLYELRKKPEWSDIPVIFCTGVNNRQQEEKALSMGAVDYITKPISVGVLRKRIQLHLEFNVYHKKMEKLVEHKTKQLLTTQDLILDILANVTTFRDNDTGAHIIRTTKYSKIIVDRLLEIQHPNYLINETYADHIVKSARLHDIGKIGISDGILHKKTHLTPEEFDVIKRHTIIGAKMISGAISNLGDDASFLVTAREIVLYHHEWWNGKGYPKRLVGNEIPISSRVMAIADVYDALISNRPYKKAFSHEVAVDIIKKDAGTHFDDVLIDITNELFPKFKEISQTYRDE